LIKALALWRHLAKITVCFEDNGEETGTLFSLLSDVSSLKSNLSLSSANSKSHDMKGLHKAFVVNFGVQTTNRVGITNFNNINQRKDETVQ